MERRCVNQAGLDLIKSFEGCRLTSYPDTGGVWTIGYGHTKGVARGQTITGEEAEAFLRADLASAEQDVDRLVKVELSDNQFAALVSFVFNLGGGAFSKSTLLRLLNKGQYAQVPEQFMRWVNDNGKRLPGLVRRRKAEAELFGGQS